MTRRYAMLVKEKKPNEYTRAREGESRDRHTPQAQAPAHRQGPVEGQREPGRQPRGSSHWDWARQDRAGEEPHGKGNMAPYRDKIKTSRRPQEPRRGADARCLMSSSEKLIPKFRPILPSTRGVGSVWSYFSYCPIYLSAQP